MSLTKKHLKFASLYFHTTVSLNAFVEEIPTYGSKLIIKCRHFCVVIWLHSSPGSVMAVTVLFDSCAVTVQNETVDPVQLPECQHLHSLAPVCFWQSWLRNHWWFIQHRVKLSLTLRGAAAGSVETHTGVLGKFTPSGLLLCFPVCKYDFSILDTYARAGALSLKSLDAVVPCVIMEWPMGLVTSNAGFVFAAERVPITKVREQETRLQSVGRW